MRRRRILPLARARDIAVRYGPRRRERRRRVKTHPPPPTGTPDQLLKLGPPPRGRPANHTAGSVWFASQCEPYCAAATRSMYPRGSVSVSVAPATSHGVERVRSHSSAIAIPSGRMYPVPRLGGARGRSSRCTTSTTSTRATCPLVCVHRGRAASCSQRLLHVGGSQDPDRSSLTRNHQASCCRFFSQ